MSDDALHQIMESQKTMAEDVSAISTELRITGEHYKEHMEKQDKLNDQFFAFHRKTTSRLDKAEGGMKVIKIVGTIISGITGIVLTILGFNIKP